MPHKGYHLSDEHKEKIRRANLGKHRSEETRAKMSQKLIGNQRYKGHHPSEETRKLLARPGSKNPAWKGDGPIHYSSLHEWLRKNWPEPKPELCQICNIAKARHIANISPTYNPETYTRDFKNYRWLCVRCHFLSDGRKDKLRRGRK